MMGVAHIHSMKLNVHVIIFPTSQGASPAAVIPTVLEDVVPAILQSLDKKANDELNLFISTENLGKGFNFL